ncbi:hypothetical protein HYX16_05985 [Candidatus Woesearchaeota archaeon]|nr:hypothetical protein [Candidatus Woesearchaeota archaeon]
MDTLEQAVEKFEREGFEKKILSGEHLQAIKQAQTGSEFVVTFDKKDGLYSFNLISPQFLKVGKHYLSTVVSKKLIENGIFAPDVDNVKLKKIMEDIKKEIGLPEGIKLGRIYLDYHYISSFTVQGQNFDETYEMFRVAAEKFNCKID